MSIPQFYIPSQTEIDTAISAVFGDGTEAEAPRYTRAATLLAAGAVHFTDADGWTVTSQSKPGTYHVNRERCECYAQAQHGGECKHMLAVRLYLSIITARLRTDLAAPFGVDVWGEDVVTREATPQLICRAVQTRQGWRPATGAEVAAYARYLAGTLGEDQVSLGAVLGRATGESLTLSFDVYSAGAGVTCTFTGYHIPPAQWVKFDYADRQTIAAAAADALLRLHGWEMAQRPVKWRSMEHRYILRRVSSNPAEIGQGYSIASRTDAAVERAHQERVFAQMDGRETPTIRKTYAPELRAA